MLKKYLIILTFFLGIPLISNASTFTGYDNFDSYTSVGDGTCSDVGTPTLSGYSGGTGNWTGNWDNSDPSTYYGSLAPAVHTSSGGTDAQGGVSIHMYGNCGGGVSSYGSINRNFTASTIGHLHFQLKISSANPPGTSWNDGFHVGVSSQSGVYGSQIPLADIGADGSTHEVFFNMYGSGGYQKQLTGLYYVPDQWTDFDIFWYADFNFYVAVNGTLSTSFPLNSARYSDSIDSVVIYNDSTSVQYELDDFGDHFPPVVIPTNPRIISVFPQGTTTPSTSVILNANIYNDSAEFVRFNLANYDTNFQYLPIDIPILFSGQGSVSTTTTLTQGFYIGDVEMIGGGTQATSSKPIQFTVVSSATGGVSFDISSSTLPLSTTTPNSFVSCIANLSNCVKSFLVTSDTPLLLTQGINEVQFTMSSKIPFGYITNFKNIFSQFSTTSTTTYPTFFPTSSSLVNFFSPIRLALGSMVALLMLFTMFYRFKNYDF